MSKPESNDWASGVITLLLVAPMTIWWAFVTAKLWAWFAVPILGLPHIGMAQAAGLCTVVAMFKSAPAFDDRDEWEKLKAFFFRSLLFPAISLLMGWIVKGLL